jgi:serine/threonine protein kinase/tetratricopeptide (TPR) repeat protein
MNSMPEASSRACPGCGGPTFDAELFCVACRTAMSPATTGFGDAATMFTPPPTSNSDPDVTMIGPPVSRGTFGDATTMFTPPPTSNPDPDVTMIGPPAGRGTFDDTPTIIPTASAANRPIDVAPVASHGESGPLSVGQRFGRYTIVRLLGIGGMGAVYQAWDEELEVVVALKVIRPDVLRDPAAEREIASRFKRELLLARQVTHKNVVRIHDLGEIDGIKYITMSFVNGIDLATLVKADRRLPVPKALRIVRSVVSGLVAAHAAGVVHRDLKPANIMIDASGEALIMDFGIARSTGGPSEARATPSTGSPPESWRATARSADATMAGTIVGTIEYMAPEQAKGQPADQRADIYATGLILYDLLTGRRRAEHAESPVAELRARMEHPLPPLKLLAPEVPNTVAAIVERAIERDEAKRYQTTVELSADLDRLDESGELLPEPRRFTPRMIAAAAVAVAALVTGTWWLTHAPPAPKQHPTVTVVIADLQNNTGDPTFDRLLEPTLKRALEGTSFINAYDRAGIGGTIGVPLPEKLDETTARQLAVNQGLGVVLSGAIDRQRSGYRISVKAVQAATGKVLVDVNGRASDKDQLLGTATKLVSTVRNGLGDDTSGSAREFAVALSATSLEAVRYHAAGMEATAAGRYEEALQSFSKAVEVDPKFGIGYQGMAAASLSLRKRKDAEKYVDQALRYLTAMTPRERNSTRGLSYLLAGDYKACVREYSDLVAQYPADVLGHNNLAVCFSSLRQMRKALDEMWQALAILPNKVVYRSNFALQANYATDFPTAEREARKIQEPSPKAVVALAYAQLGQGQLPLALETYRKLGTMGADGASRAASGLGDLALYEGRVADAVRILAEGAADDLSSKNPDRAGAKFAALAYARLLARDKNLAIAAADKALASSRAVTVRFVAARVFIEAGKVAEARKLVADLSKEFQAEPQAYGKIAEGEIALTNKDPRQAIKLFGEANNLLDTWIGHFDLGRAYLEAGALDRSALINADSEFDRCINRRGEALELFLDNQPTYGYLPLVYYYQGLVREALKTEGFAESYRTYLKIREKAGQDPLLPEVRRRAGR